MIIFLYGEDTYRIKKKTEEITERYKKIHKSGLNLRCLDFSRKEPGGVSFSGFEEGIRQTSMFKEKKLAIIINPFSDADFKEKFLKKGRYFADSQDIVVICQEGEVDKRNSLFKFLKKKARFQEFKFLRGQNLVKWAEKEFAKYKTKIEQKVLKKIVERVGSDLWRLSGEIKKLASFKKEIKSKDVELLIKSKIETDIFKTIDAAAQKRKKDALKLLHEHLEKGDSPLYVLSMINYQFRNLLIIKDLIEKGNSYNILLKKSGLHPFVVRKNYFQSQKFTLSDLKKIYRKILQADVDIKTGRAETETVLDLLIAQI